MIFGIGTDIVDVDRLRAVWSRHGDKFLKRVFTPDEINYCLVKADPVPCLAARFAAKEAAVKALGTGISQGVGFRDVQVKSNGSRPRVELDGRARWLAEEQGISDIHLSLSHEKNFALALVIMETNKEKFISSADVEDDERE
ncbi:MAG: holo-ACP synthase [Deltaproteobacteria bacterium]|nr:holo-ACP synthase [Deltaproteobacteria bacterium]